MKTKPWVLIFLLSLALSIQNTCPFGAAGKTAVVSAFRDCPLKHSIVVTHDGLGSITRGSSTTPCPQYVFVASEAIAPFSIASIASEKPIFENSYKDALPDKQFRPPRARAA